MISTPVENGKSNQSDRKDENSKSPTWRTESMALLSINIPESHQASEMGTPRSTRRSTLSSDSSLMSYGDSKSRICKRKAALLLIVILIIVFTAIAAYTYNSNMKDIECSIENPQTEKKVPSDSEELDALHNGPLSKTKYALETLKELNFARTEPKRYAKERVEPLLKTCNKGKRGWHYLREGRKKRIKETPAVFHEAVKFLNEQKALAPFKAVVEPLCKSARDHVNDTGSKGIKGHDGSDKSRPSDRIKRYCYAPTHRAENIHYGSGAENPIDAVRSLIVDDGVPNRGHRTNIFNPNLAYLGVYEGTFKAKPGNPDYQIMVVHNMASEILPLRPELEAQSFPITDVDDPKMKPIYKCMRTKKKFKIKEIIQKLLKEERCHQVKVTYSPKKLYDGDNPKYKGETFQTLRLDGQQKFGHQGEDFTFRSTTHYIS